MLPLLFALTVVSEAVQRSIGGAASAVTGATALGGGGGSDGAAAGVGGLGASAGVGGFAGTSSLDVGRVLQGAGDVADTLFVVWTVWYMLRFFR